MNWILNIPIEARLAFLFLLGLAIGGQLNRGIYRLAWMPRDIGPWSARAKNAPARHWSDRLPMIGWWGLRREASVHGRAYWLRPMAIELATGIGFAALYWLETERLLLWPSAPDVAAPSAFVVHTQYLSHIVLISLMMVATFIDFDEQTIPDEITVTGAVIGLLLVVALPSILLPTVLESGLRGKLLYNVVLTSSTTSANWIGGLGGPFSWPRRLNDPFGLVLGLAGIWSWCYAITHKTWTTRRGLGKAIKYMVASVKRRRTWRLPLVLAVALSSLVVLTWFNGGLRWQSLLSAIVGICFGGGLIWAVRIVGGHALRVEAMGFGDVTLMAMIGAFVGWQASFLIFFLAPFTALFVAAAQRILTGNRQIAFGPYLCVSTLIVIIGWDFIWDQWARPMFGYGWFIPGMLACCLLLMGGLLWCWRMVRDAIF